MLDRTLITWEPDSFLNMTESYRQLKRTDTEFERKLWFWPTFISEHGQGLINQGQLIKIIPVENKHVATVVYMIVRYEHSLLLGYPEWYDYFEMDQFAYSWWNLSLAALLLGFELDFLLNWTSL